MTTSGENPATELCIRDDHSADHPLMLAVLSSLSAALVHDIISRDISVKRACDDELSFGKTLGVSAARTPSGSRWRPGLEINIHECHT